ncbi:HDOD domain-containing protein [Pelagicoccus sp. SDUM812003]|uniref:HDOD domain-containing protein n=1 Tax=Pelagicoccus sp. SDUM812003 TaxID=3041267 RepID=UPI002810991D|nr:HDOD domain-containing protein [Pelagicoccus sp. SDUM812003]MDQ8204126.1 HDOD domain-containing protein [Pelagicoccus sp. SDUM812003]
MSFDQIEKINLELLLEYSSSLPASPRIFARLSQLIQNEDTALDYITSLVKMDPGLAAQILRVTNSAYYGASFKINDLDTAISRIGFREVQKVLSMVVAHECFYQALPLYGITATEFADQCVDVAVTSETLAKRVGFDPNNPYITGLLHIIGKLAINLYLERLDQLADISGLVSESRPLESVEMDLFGMTHHRVGAELLSHWQFEPACWQPIKNQSYPASASTFLKETALLSLARWIATKLAKYDWEDATPEHIRSALSLLGIDPLDIPMLIDEARFEINDRKNMLSMLL